MQVIFIRLGNYQYKVSNHLPIKETVHSTFARGARAERLGATAPRQITFNLQLATCNL
jgi:hypothetical protein